MNRAFAIRPWRGRGRKSNRSKDASNRGDEDWFRIKAHLSADRRLRNVFRKNEFFSVNWAIAQSSAGKLPVNTSPALIKLFCGWRFGFDTEIDIIWERSRSLLRILDFGGTVLPGPKVRYAWADGTQIRHSTAANPPGNLPPSRTARCVVCASSTR